MPFFQLLLTASGPALILSLGRNLVENPWSFVLVIAGVAALLLGVAGLVQTRNWPRATAPARVRRLVAAPTVQPSPRHPVAARTEAAQPALPPRSDTDRLRIDFVGIESRHPDVWAPDQSLDLRVVVGPGLVPPRSAPTIRLLLASGGAEWALGVVAPDDELTARFTLAPRAGLGAAAQRRVAGDATRGEEAHLVARLEVDGRPAGQVVRGIRFVPYRDEVVETFEDFIKWASAQYAFVDRRMTAREFVDRFADAVPGCPVAPLDRIVDLYELANYSDHLVDRSLYLEFVEAFLELEDAGALEGPGGEAR